MNKENGDIHDYARSTVVEEAFDPEFGARNDYLLCYDNLIVEISFDWEPTAEQMAIVGEKLS